MVLINLVSYSACTGGKMKRSLIIAAAVIIFVAYLVLPTVFYPKIELEEVSFAKIRIMPGGKELHFVDEIIIKFTRNKATVTGQPKLIPGEYTLQLNPHVDYRNGADTGRTIRFNIAQRNPGLTPNVFLAERKELFVKSPILISGGNIFLDWYTSSQDKLYQQYESSPPYPTARFKTLPNIEIRIQSGCKVYGPWCKTINGYEFTLLIEIPIEILEIT